MKQQKLILIFIIIFTSYGCSIRDYYFPMSDLTESKIYKYECKSDSSLTEYWKITSNLTDNTLITEAFSYDYIQYEFFKEKITEKGSKLLEFISYKNNNESIDTVINKPIKLDVFKWDKSGTYIYSSESIDNYYGKISFEKEREYISVEKLIILNKEYSALKFKGIYTTKINSINKSFKKEQFSYYAKGIGLVKMEKKFSDGTEVILELTEIMTNNEWTNKLNSVPASL